MGQTKRSLENWRESYRRDRVQIASAIEAVERDWTHKMVVYWQERIDKLHINDTGALRSSIIGMVHAGSPTMLEHKFLQYGISVSNGTAREFGNGYTDRLGRRYNYTNIYNHNFASKRGIETPFNAGQLPFLLPGGEEYRKEHGLDKRKKVGPAWRGRVAGGRPHRPRDWFFRKYYASRMVLNDFEASAYGEAYQGMLLRIVDNVMAELRFL